MLIFLLGFSFDREAGGRMFSEMSVDYYRAAWLYIPEDRALDVHRC
jgi:hypothetical protein